MSYYGFNYNVDEHTGTMVLFTNDNRVICEISGCQNMTEQELNILADDILKEHGYIKDNYFSE